MHNRIPREIVTKPVCGGELRQAAPHATRTVPHGEEEEHGHGHWRRASARTAAPVDAVLPPR